MVLVTLLLNRGVARRIHRCCIGVVEVFCNSISVTRGSVDVMLLKFCRGVVREPSRCCQRISTATIHSGNPSWCDSVDGVLTGCCSGILISLVSSMVKEMKEGGKHTYILQCSWACFCEGRKEGEKGVRME